LQSPAVRYFSAKGQGWDLVPACLTQHTAPEAQSSPQDSPFYSAASFWDGYSSRQHCQNDWKVYL